MLDQFLPRQDFSSYDDFQHHFRIDVPDNFNFAYDVVDRFAVEQPDKRALVWCTEEGDSRTITFAELKQRSDEVACYLQQLGIGKGDPVMLILRRRYEFWYTLIALHKLGAIAIPATHMLTTRDLIYRNNAADIKAIIAVNEERVTQHIDDAVPESPSLRHRIVLDGSRTGWACLQDAFTGNGAAFTRPTGVQATVNTDIMLIYFTSGTTGMPKMVQQDYTYPFGHIVTASYWQRVRNDGLHFTVADTGWAKSAWGKIYGQWLSGCAVFVFDYERFDAVKMLNVIAEYKVTTFCAPPTVFRYLVQEDLSQFDLSSLEFVATAGEPLNPEVFQKFYRATGLKMAEGYGQTETTVMIANFPWIEPRPGSMGKPSPQYQIELLNDDGEPCQAREHGQIVIRTERGRPVGMFESYYRDQTLNARVWCDGTYYTGDVAWYDEQGYFWFVGRADDLIKTSGYRVSPFEVESALMEHPAVLECAVTGVPDEIRGQVVKATVVLAKSYEPGDTLVKELQSYVKEITAPYAYPRIIEFVEQLPKTISGKIRRVELRQAAEVK